MLMDVTLKELMDATLTVTVATPADGNCSSEVWRGGGDGDGSRCMGARNIKTGKAITFILENVVDGPGGLKVSHTFM